MSVFFLKHIILKLIYDFKDQSTILLNTLLYF
jgi:hypothetical protein